MLPKKYSFPLNTPFYSALILFTVSACGGGSSSTPSQSAASLSASLNDELQGKSITQVGVVQYRKAESTSSFGFGINIGSTIGARFYQYEAPLNANSIQALVNEYSTGTSEYCKIRIGTWTGDNGPLFPHPVTLEASSTISAGTVLPVQGPQGSLTELHAQAPENYDWVHYYSQTSSSVGYLDDHLPQNASISLPGDSFPAFNNIGIPDIDLVNQGIEVSNTGLDQTYGSEILTEESAITWGSSTHTDGYAWIHGYTATNFDNVPTRFVCYVADDGHFTLPENLSNAVTSASFPVDELRIWRERINFAVNDGALVVVKTSGGFFSPSYFLNMGPTLWDW